LLVRSLRTLWLVDDGGETRHAMSFANPRIAKVRISKDASLGATMNQMRTWLDKQKIQPARWEGSMVRGSPSWSRLTVTMRANYFVDNSPTQRTMRVDIKL
jgi:hypothetical protein